MTAERIGGNYLLRLHSQTVKPIAQINRTTREKDLRASRQIDHSALRIARRTCDSAFSFTKPPTQCARHSAMLSRSFQFRRRWLIDRPIENDDQHRYLFHDADIGVSRVTGYRGSIMFRRFDTVRRALGLDSDDGPNWHSLRKNLEQAMQPDEEKGSPSPPSRL